MFVSVLFHLTYMIPFRFDHFFAKGKNLLDQTKNGFVQCWIEQSHQIERTFCVLFWQHFVYFFVWICSLLTLHLVQSFKTQYRRFPFAHLLQENILPGRNSKCETAGLIFIQELSKIIILNLNSDHLKK